MTINDIEDIARTLDGYDHWRTKQALVTERDMSVSAYVDELAKLRALEIVQQIQAVYADKNKTWVEIDAEIQRLVGASS